MPVRIIFRGLMLFRIPDAGPNAKKLVAYLINDPKFGDGKPGHPHDHEAEVQILTGAEKGADLVPQSLTRRATLDIIAEGQTGVVPRLSFHEHLPNLEGIIAKAIPAIQNAGKGAPNRQLIQNVVTVNRGIVRVKDVTVWDQGGFPLSGNRDEIGQGATSPVVSKFMGSSVRGHIATEVVVDIDDTDAVKLECDHDNRFKGPRTGTADPIDPHVPAGTVEILIENYERAGATPTPWGLDFQWLFAAAGYRPADLSSSNFYGADFEAWVDAGRKFAKAFEPELFDTERTMFLSGEKNTTGWPFPYLDPKDAVTPLEPLTSLKKPLVCVLATTYTALPSPLAPSVIAARRLAAMKKTTTTKARGKKTAVKKTAIEKTVAKKTSRSKPAAKRDRGR